MHLKCFLWPCKTLKGSAFQKTLPRVVLATTRASPPLVAICNHSWYPTTHCKKQPLVVIANIIDWLLIPRVVANCNEWLRNPHDWLRGLFCKLSTFIIVRQTLLDNLIKHPQHNIHFHIYQMFDYSWIIIFVD